MVKWTLGLSLLTCGSEKPLLLYLLFFCLHTFSLAHKFTLPVLLSQSLIGLLLFLYLHSGSTIRNSLYQYYFPKVFLVFYSLWTFTMAPLSLLWWRPASRGRVKSHFHDYLHLRSSVILSLSLSLAVCFVWVAIYGSWCKKGAVNW